MACRQFVDFLQSQTELDVEAESLKRFRADFGEGPGTIAIPKVYETWVTPDVLVMSYEEGDSLKSLLQADRKDTEARADKVEAWKQILDAMCKMVFKNKYVHGDLHPGNILWGIDGNGKVRITFLDVGLAIDLKGDVGDDFAMMIRAVLTESPDQVGWNLIKLSERVGGRREDVWDPEGFAKGIGELITEAKGCAMKLSKLNATALFTKSLVLGRRHQVRFDQRFVNLLLSGLVLQGVLLNLNPDGDILSRVAPYFGKAAIVALATSRRDE
jgi:predicted unusual protein kinase regulating ubiquinone biosynthesis (AarF/ABC1/UbiB family)